ncbi:mechanosensitive ion channel family protein [Sulfurovum sp. NBC37-1]|uniref:mechanosensitive ion channel family protein n=1 Tax=Sulfurovum sp. (strain NBC37-1) TaxID=387093 RepID=UPI000158761C|nr:mechanosensitive ion channel domain-containing protein [Sulfurovum sp. NBC37-1]BAF71242.1 conserved hypothetical protein [Sulfurovum sp. NBC37-1]
MFLHRLLKLLFLCLLAHNLLQAADLNTSLISGDKTIYAQLQDRLKQTEPKNDEILLQETLLKKLINFQENIPQNTTTYVLPKDEKEARTLFTSWIENLSKKVELEQQQKSLLNKMATLKKQIEEMPAKDASLLTYQLQYALYVKNNRSVQQQIKILGDQEKELSTLFHRMPKTLLLNQKLLADNQEKLLQYLIFQKKILKSLQTKKERLTLLGNVDQLEQLARQQTEEQNIYTEISKVIAATDFMLFCDALHKKDQTAFKWEKEILVYTNDAEEKHALKKLLKEMEKEYLGIVNTISGSTVQDVKYTADSARKLLAKPLFKINETPISIFKIVLVLLVLVIGFLIGKFFKYTLHKNPEEDDSSTLANSSRMILSNLGYYIIIVITFLGALKVLGINLSSLAIVAGALSVGIGFGLQNIVSNSVSGLILMFEESIKIGDYVQLDENLKGHVTDIRMRATTIKTNSNIDVIIPNQNFIQNNVVNWTMEDDIRRIEVPFGVRYGTKPETVIRVVLEAVKKSGFKDIYTSRRRITRVVMTEMGDSSVNFELLVWIKGKEILYPKRTMSRFLILIYNALYENNIEIPFPQRDLHIRSIDKEIVFPMELDIPAKEPIDEK